MTIIKSPVSNPDFNTLILSKDRLFFDEIADHLRRSDSERTLKLSQAIADLQPIELWLGKCDIMICDFRRDYSLLETASLLVESAPIQLMAIGLIDAEKLDDDSLSLTACVRLTDFLRMQDGWKCIWNHISKIKHSWNNPLMVSKIEDVPVSDILQMIAIGRWNSMVQIQGRVTMSKKTGKKIVERIRGNIFFWNGKPLAAWSSLNVGAQAVCDLLSLKQGILRVTRPIQAPPFRNIQMDIQDILLSYAVSLDESSKQALPPSDDPDHSGEPSEPDAPPSIDLPVIEPEEAAGGTKEPQSSQPSFLHSGWAHNIVPLCNTLLTTEPRSLPLRWMKNAELEKLILPETESEFLVFRASRQFLLPMLGLCARDIAGNKFDEEWIPILRLGRHLKFYLYLACLETAAVCLPLSGFPCAAYSHHDDLPSTLQSITLCGHPVGIFLVPDSEHTIPGDIIREHTAPYIRKSIAAPRLSWDSISQTLVKILTILSDLSSGDVR